MLRCGIPVPPGFVVTRRALEAFLRESSLAPAIARLESRLADSDRVEIPEISSSVRGLVLGSPLPAGVREDIFRYWADILDRRSVIVRSSGIGEDSADASFAGLLDSFPDVTSEEELERAMKACWASQWSDRSLTYQLARGRRLRGMGVVIQLQVRASISGVLFTQPPTSSETPGTLVGEFVYGPGETLVSGRLDPGRFAVSRRDLRCLRFTGAPETPEAAVACFDEAWLAPLSKLGLQVEKLFGAPQDIEWTLDAGGRLHIVQSRAITTATTAGRSQVVWSNANVNENFPGPVVPFLYSIASTGYEHYFRNLGLAFGVSRRRLDAADAAFRHIIGVHAARIYYNLTNIHRVLRSVPFGAWLTRSFDDFVGIPADEETEPVEEKLRFWPVVELAWVLIKTGRLYLTLERRVGEFERTADGFAEQWRPERLKDCPLAELLEALHAFVDIRSHRWLGASLADAAAMVTSGALQALLGNERRAAGFGELLSGLPDMVSAQPAVKLWDLSRRIRNEPDLDALFRDQGASEIWSTLRARPRFAEFRLAVDEYLENWGFRFSGELMMTVPSFQERPERLMELLKSYLRLDAGSPLERLQAEGEGRLAATERVRIDLRRERLCRRLPLRKSFVFPRLLSWTQTSVILRERARLKQALLYSRCRRIVLAIGEKLAGNDAVKEQDDVFFLTWQELEALLSAGAMFPGLPRKQVAIRKEEHAQWSLLAPPDHFVLPEGAYWDAGTSPASVREGPPGDPRKILYGIGAGTGKVQGPAAVLQDISECGRLRGGDVLVARQTDPGWGPLFPLIKGLVLERGGVLSHGAILAREFGIASVVGVKEATRLIADGRPIEIDGDLGHVHFMD
jgi:pyruvate,water dikinase